MNKFHFNHFRVNEGFLFVQYAYQELHIKATNIYNAKPNHQ